MGLKPADGRRFGVADPDLQMDEILNKKRHGREAEDAAANAVQVFGAYGFSDEYPVERFYRNSKGASIYEGTREIHTLMQADYALGFREDKELERDLPKVDQ